MFLCAHVLMRTCAATITLETPDTRGTLEQAKMGTEDNQNAWQRRRTSIWAKKPANASLSMPSMPFNCLRGKRDKRDRESKLHQICTHAEEPGGKGDGQNLSCRPWSALPSEILRGRFYYTTVKKHCVVSSTVQSSIHLD